MHRPHVCVFVAASLDGFIADEHNRLDWLKPFNDSPEQTGYARLHAQADTFVLGRNSYETVLGFDDWPYPGKHVVVISRRNVPGRFNEEAFSGKIEDLMYRLWLRGSRHVWLDGGVAIRQALAAGCVDEMTISWAPVLLGRGVRLFGPEVQLDQLLLSSTQQLPSGLVQCTYSLEAAVSAHAAPI